MVVQDDSEEITDKGSKEEDEKKAESDEKEEEKPEEKPKSDYGLEMKCEEVKHSRAPASPARSAAAARSRPRTPATRRSCPTA